MAPERLISLDNVHNFRDLGGYRTADGRHVRWRSVFRADGLYRLSSDDLDVLRPLGLRTVIDLRSADELDQRGRFPHEHYPVSFHHLPVIDTTWQKEDVPETNDAVEFLTWAYREMLEQGAPRFAQALHVLGLPGALPAVFHCAAGKDRTGLMSALLLSALGVSDDDIVDDYALTEPAMQRMREWVQRTMPEMAASMADAPSAMLAAHPDAMRIILGDLHREHGSVIGYLAGIGVGEGLVRHLRDNLLE